MGNVAGAPVGLEGAVASARHGASVVWLVGCGEGGGESVDGDAIWRLVNRVVTHVPAGGFQVSLRCYDQQLPRRGSWQCGGGVCRVGILVVGLEGGVVVVSCTIVFGDKGSSVITRFVMIQVLWFFFL